MPHVYIEDIGKHTGEEVTIKGWLHNRRSSGKIHFLTVRDGSGFIQDDDRAGRKRGTCVGVAEQLCQRHGGRGLLTERVGGGGGGRAEDRGEPFVAEQAGQFDQGGAFARAGQATEAGKLVRAGEDVGQGFALVGAEARGRVVTTNDWRDRLDAGVDGANQEQLFGENVAGRELGADADQFGAVGQLFL